jgi:hypothetical protein
MKITPKQYVPLPYQPLMLKHLEEHPKSLLFVEMGLGKTVVVLKRISDMICQGEIRAALIVAPLRVSLLTWVEQIETWEHSSWMRAVNMNTPEGAAAWEAADAEIFIVHYDVLSTREVTRTCRKCKGNGCATCGGAGSVLSRHPGFAEKFMKGRKRLPVDMVVYDEISVFKDPAGKRAKAMAAHHHHFPYRIGMSGTPLGNSRLNLFNQVRMIDDGERLGKSFFRFREHYAESDFMGYKWTMRPGANEKIDQAISDIALVLLCEDHANLPPCYLNDIEVTLPAEAEKQYRKIEKELLLELEKGDIVAASAAVLAGKMLQITGGACYGDDKTVHHIHTAKIDALKKLRKQLGPREPLIVLVAFRHESARVMEAIPGCRMFDIKDIDEWREGKIHTICADARSLSHGIDSLQVSCCNMVWFTPHWSAEITQQTIKRIHRRGNPRDTHIWRLVAKIKGHLTVDEAVIESNREHTNEQTGMFSSLRKIQRLNQQKKP